MLIMLFILALVFNQLLVYGISQGKGQLKIVLGAVPVSDVINDPVTPDSVKRKLLLIQEIREFAFDSLGINESENYTTFFDQKGKALLWVLTAAEPYEMKSYQWKFPVVGKVGYKGFFNLNRGIIERAQLKAKGYDTDLGKVSGWSTLGYFKDPVLSQMLRNNDGMLAELIIHELTHGTIYVKSDVTFNENLASFIGEQGAVMFLDHHYGKNSKELKEYLDERSDHKAFSTAALKYSKKLDSLYRLNLPEEKTKENKQALIMKFVREIRHHPFNNRRFNSYAKKAYSAGNAFFLSYVRYDSKLKSFEKELNDDHNGNLRSFLDSLKLEYGVR